MPEGTTLHVRHGMTCCCCARVRVCALQLTNNMPALNSSTAAHRMRHSSSNTMPVVFWPWPTGVQQRVQYEQ